MKKSIFILLTLCPLLFFISCKKAGLGGDANVAAYPKHHGNAIFGATVYIKFNAEDAPGSGTDGYDATYVAGPNDDYVKIEGLKKGKYYVYAVGFDPSIGETVRGGQSFKIERQDKDNELHVDISVTE